MVSVIAGLPRHRSQGGTSMIEVLVTMVILAIGLLGLAGLQSRLGVSQMESYQRAQALVLLQDMASRIATNRANAASYVTGTANPLPNGGACPAAAGTRGEIDANQWCNALLGAAEIYGGGKAGAMVGARGCVEALSSNEYLERLTKYLRLRSEYANRSSSSRA